MPDGRLNTHIGSSSEFFNPIKSLIESPPMCVGRGVAGWISAYSRASLFNSSRLYLGKGDVMLFMPWHLSW